MVDAVVSPIMSPIVSAVDVDDVVERIDVEQVIERIDIDRLVDRLDLDRVIERVDFNGVIERVDVNGVIDRVDANALLDRVDPNALLDRVDPDRLLARVDPNALLDRVDPNALLDRVDADRLLDRVDADRLLDRVDANRLLDRVDPNALLDRIDADRLVARVDANALLDRVDVNRVIERVDLDAVMARVDVNELVRRTELGSVIARSTTGVFGELLDAARAVSVSLDLVVHGVVRRMFRHSHEGRPGKPGDLDDVVDTRTMSLSERGVAVQGRFCGSVSRLLAFVLDQFLIGLLFVWGRTLVSLAVEVVTGSPLKVPDHRWLVAAVYLVWAFVYLAAPLAAVGRTIGMSVLGLQVVTSDGERLDGRHAVVRTMAFPLSFVLGIGFLIGLFRRDRRELHDLIAGTAVVYAWDAELARLRASRAADPVEPTTGS